MFIITVFLLFLAMNTSWFVWHSARLGLQGLASDSPGEVSRVFFSGSIWINVSIAAHMIAGAVLTIGAPLQALPFLRRRLPVWHRRLGYLLFGLACVTGVGGLFYIVFNGTVGGLWMSFWFAIYGAALITAATATVRFAIEKDWSRHFAWATRFVILAVGSWIYRMHYGFWYATTGGLEINEDFTGLFDRVQVFAFFVPYILVAEILLRRKAWSLAIRQRLMIVRR
ncbi:MAG: DUF2306 domain-containing protein [Pseudomonadota bacterium]